MSNYEAKAVKAWRDLSPVVTQYAEHSGKATALEVADVVADTLLNELEFDDIKPENVPGIIKMILEQLYGETE